MASLQPCHLIPDRSWWARFLHSTDLGAKLASKIFSALDNTVRKYADYRERKSDKGFEKLKYDNDIIWQNGTAGGCHFADFGSLVAEKVLDSWSIAGVKLLSENGPYLNDENGTHFPCDAILCETRWESGFKMFENCTLLELGLPYPKNIEPQKETAKWDKLVGNADEQILKRFVMLGNPLKYYYKYETRTPYRLYRTIDPLHDDPILLMNHIVAGAKLFAAEAQAIWANKRRYLSGSELGNFAAFGSVPYVDTLFDEIGVESRRKKGGWLGNIFALIMPANLGKVWREYLARQAKQ